MVAYLMLKTNSVLKLKKQVRKHCSIKRRSKVSMATDPSTPKGVLNWTLFNTLLVLQYHLYFYIL